MPFTFIILAASVRPDESSAHLWTWPNRPLWKHVGGGQLAFGTAGALGVKGLAEGHHCSEFYSIKTYYLPDIFHVPTELHSSQTKQHRMFTLL